MHTVDACQPSPVPLALARTAPPSWRMAAGRHCRTPA
jgi:hypothetical protein